MIEILILNWANRYLERDILQKYKESKEKLCDELLVELVDCRAYNKAYVVLNYCSSTHAIKESLYIALAMWREKKSDRFIHACMNKLGYINPSNCPTFLMNILIGGAYPYLLPALKVGFLRETTDPSLERHVIYDPDMRQNQAWLDFVNWLDEIKDTFNDKHHLGFTIDSLGIKMQNFLKWRFLRTRNFAQYRKGFYCGEGGEYTFSVWKKKFYYMLNLNRQRPHHNKENRCQSVEKTCSALVSGRISN